MKKVISGWRKPRAVLSLLSGQGYLSSHHLLNMKRNTIIKLSFLTYILCGIGIFFCVKASIEAKDRRLKSEALNNLEEYFSRQEKFVSVRYSGKKVSYEQISLPKYEEKSLSITPNEDKNNWNEAWGDLYQLYKLKPKYTSDSSIDTDRQWTGWLLEIVEKDGFDGFETYLVYPYKVGYRKQENSWAYKYMPTIQDAIDEAFEFHTTNEKSSYTKYMTRSGSIDEYDVIKAVENEYYYCFSYDKLVEYNGKHVADSIMMWTNWEKMGADGSYRISTFTGGDYGYMYNGYYKVYNYTGPRTYYQIKYRYYWDPKKYDINRALIWAYSILTLLLLWVVIPLSVIESRKRKEKFESIKDKLLRMCNPAHFMNPYDEKKVSVANDLYEKIMNTSAEDFEQLKCLRKEASRQLGINFIDPDILKELIETINPAKYTKPYNAEKVRIANRLYTRLKSEGIDIDEIEEIEKEINEKLIGNSSCNDYEIEDYTTDSSNENFSV